MTSSPEVLIVSSVLVTGGAGFIGSHLVDRLVREGHDVTVLDNLVTGKQENLNSQARFIKCDVSDYPKVTPYFRRIEAVFHCAALARIQPSIRDPLAVNQANITGTLNVLWAAKSAGVQKVIYSASSSVYGDQPADYYPLKETTNPNPGSPYSLSKLGGEMYCQLFSKLYNLPTVILRYFNVYGPRQIMEGAYATVIGIFFKQRQEGLPMTVVEDGSQKRRDYTYVSDVVEANILAWQKDIGGGEIFNIGFGKNYSVTEIATLIGGLTVTIPQKPGEYLITWADNSKAKKVLGWQPKISLEEGLKELKKFHGL